MIERTIAFLDNLTLEELDRLPPAQRRRFASLCHHWAQLAERRGEQQPKSGVLSKLKDGERAE
jgi:hypothetical protein